MLTLTHLYFPEKAMISLDFSANTYLLRTLARSCGIWKYLQNMITLEKEHSKFMKSSALNLENTKTRVAYVTLSHLS